MAKRKKKFQKNKTKTRSIQIMIYTIYKMEIKLCESWLCCWQRVLEVIYRFAYYYLLVAKATEASKTITKTKRTIR